MITINQYKLLLLVLTFLSYHFTFAQRPDRRYIDSILLSKDTAFSSAQRIMYVVNGVPYETSALDSLLATFEIKHLLDIVYWNGAKNGHYPFFGDAALIVFAHDQRTKYKRKAFKIAKKSLSNELLPTILSIDNIEINQAVTKSTFNHLRLKDIMYMDNIQFKDYNRIRIFRRSGGTGATCPGS